MILRYIFHSGFLLETERCILIFDYWMDPADVMREYLHTSKKVYVFASHFHEDHFTKEIFNWKKSIQDVTYILSKDILRRRRANKEDADVWMAKGAVWQDGNIKVTATGSNDSGVSWIVETEGKTIFHAGDLCNWYARFITDGDSEGEPMEQREQNRARSVSAESRQRKTNCQIYSEEFGEHINPVAEEKRFLGELKDIKKVAEKFDLVMFPVDGRIGNGYTLGGRQFIERFKVGMFVPMHFVASGFESAWRMEPFCQEKGIPFWCIKAEGESLKSCNINKIEKM